MTRRVVDTNVAVVANGRDTNASSECRRAALDFLRQMVTSGQTVLDLQGEIVAEYRRKLNPDGQPGVGDIFFRMILMSSPERVERIDLPKDPVTGEFVDFPTDPALAKFDLSDRKFAAAARRCAVPVANAVDSDWLIFEAALVMNGITVEFICGRDPGRYLR